MNVVLHPSAKPTPETVLMHTLEMAKAGQIKDVMIVATLDDSENTLVLAYSNMTAGDLAIGALFIEAEIKKLCEM